LRFLLSDEQAELQAAVRDFAVARTDGGARRRAFESDSGFDSEFWSGLVDLGVTGIAAPEEAGGMGLGLLELALAAEALGYAGAPGPFLGHVLATMAIARHGSPAQKDRWLPQLANGQAVGAIAWAEPQERVRAADWTAQLTDGSLTGEKRQAPYPELANVTVVGVRGGFALVERGSPGQVVESRDVVDRTRRFASVAYDATPAEPMPAAPEAAERLVDAALILLAADAFGGATRLLEMATDYAKTREQFGGPIGRFQGLKHQLANMAVEVEPARGLYWYAAHAHDSQTPDAARVAALAKAHLGDVFMQTARAAVEAHGGIGYTWEHEAQIWFKRAMFDFSFMGAPSRHRERAARLAGW
jgi:alkylation response protein AidB-like acyl-CoA dehydrogenase